MGDILRVFNYDFETEIHTIIVGKYSQITPEIKQIQKIYKINFTKSLHNYLFGNITFEELQKYDQLQKFLGLVSDSKNSYKQQKKELITKYNMKLVINQKLIQTTTKSSMFNHKFSNSIKRLHNNLRKESSQ